MDISDNLMVLRQSFRFSLDVMDFYDELVVEKKAPIAKRILFSTLQGICCLHRSLDSEKPQEIRDNMVKAITNFKNVLYWLEQCERSGYLFREELLLQANELYAYCINEKSWK
jgi:hypothetical protein